MYGHHQLRVYCRSLHVHLIARVGCVTIADWDDMQVRRWVVDMPVHVHNAGRGSGTA